MKNKIAELHIARNERERIGDIRKMLFLIGLDVNDYTMPADSRRGFGERIRGAREIPRRFGGIEHESQNIRFNARACRRHH